MEASNMRNAIDALVVAACDVAVSLAQGRPIDNDALFRRRNDAEACLSAELVKVEAVVAAAREWNTAHVRLADCIDARQEFDDYFVAEQSYDEAKDTLIDAISALEDET